MIGVIIGDMAGSRFEWHNTKTKDFELLVPGQSRPTDDTVMSLAVARALLATGGKADGLADETVRSLRDMGRRYPKAGYGGRFDAWLKSEDPKPYYSLGNGAAMRVGPCGWAAGSLEEARILSREVTRVTHDHPSGLKAAEAVACAVYLARTGTAREEIRAFIEENYYRIGFTLDSVRPTYHFDVKCDGSVPHAFEAFFEAADYEDTVRGAVSIGGDSDTIAAIAGSVAEAYFGVPDALRAAALPFLDDFQKGILEEFEGRFGKR